MKGTRALNWRGCLGTHSWEQWLVCGRPGMFSAHGVPAHGWCWVGAAADDEAE